MNDSEINRTINVSPFPPLTWRKYAWFCRDTLQSWAGFQERNRAYCSKSSDDPSTGEVAIWIKPLEKDGIPASEQVAAYQYLMENEAAVGVTVLDAIADYYYSFPERYGLSQAEARRYLPRIRCPEDFRKHIGLSDIHILPVNKDGIAFVGFAFGCSWDSEHGLGVLMHKNRVVRAGQVAEALDVGIAPR